MITGNLWLDVGSGLVAVVFLILGADWLVERAVKVAKHLGVSTAFIGLTIISIGTSLPEIVTHVVASINIMSGAIDPRVASATVVGTNIGSDIVQQNLIIGVVALIGTVIASKKFLKHDYYVMIGAAILLWLFALGGYITRWEGAVLFIGYLVYLYFVWKDEEEDKKPVAKDKRNLWKDGFFIVIFLGIIVMSAEHILGVSETVVEELGIGASLIGILVVGVSTALPEFTTAIIGVLKKNTALSVGTLVGSNITNPMFGLGLGALISGYYVPTPIIIFDLPVKIMTSIVILYFLWKGQTKGHLGISKGEALVMICMYVGYVIARAILFPVDTY